MCTVVILSRPGHDWPILVAANRDEMLDRPWRGPARHWPEAPNVIAGIDDLAGGTWMGLNDEGVFACILNRYGSLGPQDGKRSRGELVLDALAHADADAAADALSHLNPDAYRPFNMIIADNRDAYWVYLAEADSGRRQAVVMETLPPGLHVITAFDLNDTQDPRIEVFKPAFEAADVPDPVQGTWAAWQNLLGQRHEGDTTTGLCFRTESGFGTSSSSVLALPSPDVRYATPPQLPVWQFADGAPCETKFEPVDVSG